MSKARVIWITGLSGAGKSTLAHAVAARLRAQGKAVVLLDGDELRRRDPEIAPTMLKEKSINLDYT